MTEPKPCSLASGNCQLRAGCVAAEIIVDDHGRARGVRYLDGENQAREQPADLVVVFGVGHRNGAAAAQLQVQAFP